MTVSTREELGVATGNRKWFVEVNTGTHASPTWTLIKGVKAFKQTSPATMQDSSDFDSAWKSQTVTALEWGIELTLKRKTQSADATAYDPGQEVLRAAASNVLADNRVELRWYEYAGAAGGPEVEAYTGYAAVSWEEDGGEMDADSNVTCVLQGMGSRTAITHPATAAVPTVYAVSPASGVAGDLITITGIGFTGATDVDLDATEVTDYVIHDNHTIYAVVPAGGSGAEQVLVTNATGASTEEVYFTYTA